jgi:Cu(I)/Ag(I) efflux system membrane fusion protein
LDTQIDALSASAEVARDTEILAPLTGTVVARSETAYVGGYVKAGEMLFAIGDFSKMWFVFDAYEPDLPDLRVGQSVVIDAPSLPGAPLAAPIAFIDPNLDPATRTAKVRVVLDNADRRLRHRTTAYGRVAIESPELLAAPRSAVLSTRRVPLVYVEIADHTYAPRTVKTGLVGDDYLEILSGLAAGDKVVTQGALLLDGQAQLAHGEEPSPSASSAVPVPSEALVHAAIEAASALASDDLTAYAKLLPALASTGAAHEFLMPLAAKLAAGPDLKAARLAFAPFSSAVADLVRAQPAVKRGAKIFECPMTPGIGKGRWLQHASPLRNPFFGSEMLECGDELK